MKKQILFDLASMPKMILVVTLVVMVGALFGAVTYLLQPQPQQRIPISPVPSDPPYQISDKVIIEIDKMEYKPGETAKLSIENLTGEKLSFPGSSCKPYPTPPRYQFERYNDEDDNWYDFNLLSGLNEERAKCLTVLVPCREISKDNNSLDAPLTYRVYSDGEYKDYNIPEGRYRFRFNLVQGECTYKSADKMIAVYSNEFTIKEKSALDPRCGKNVKFSGNCEMASIGFEFDSNKGKCVRKTGSCKVETPFNTLEECQEVCEKKENVAFPDKDELIKCNNNSDCVLVNSGCCGCSMGGRMICINKKYLENWNQKLKLDCKVERACPAVYLCGDNPTRCECVNNVCQGAKEWEEI